MEGGPSAAPGAHEGVKPWKPGGRGRPGGQFSGESLQHLPPWRPGRPGDRGGQSGPAESGCVCGDPASPREAKSVSLARLPQFSPRPPWSGAGGTCPPGSVPRRRSSVVAAGGSEPPAPTPCRVGAGGGRGAGGGGAETQAALRSTLRASGRPSPAVRDPREAATGSRPRTRCPGHSSPIPGQRTRINVRWREAENTPGAWRSCKQPDPRCGSAGRGKDRESTQDRNWPKMPKILSADLTLHSVHAATASV